MYIKGLTARELENCVDNLQSKYFGNVFMFGFIDQADKYFFNNKSKYFQRSFKIKLKPERSKAAGTIWYQRYGKKRAVCACCWHVFRDFFIEIYNTNPNAKIITAYARYKNKDHFYETYPNTRNKMRHDQGCDCRDEE